MACDTFIKIANKCRRHFVALQPGESEPFIDEIVRNLRKITADLSPQQIHTFYEACGYMISAQGQKSIQERLIQELMSLPNAAVCDFAHHINIWLTSVVVGQHYRTSKHQSCHPSGRRHDQSDRKHHENECCRLQLHRKLLLPADRPHLP